MRDNDKSFYGLYVGMYCTCTYWSGAELGLICIYIYNGNGRNYFSTRVGVIVSIIFLHKNWSELRSFTKFTWEKKLYFIGGNS